MKKSIPWQIDQISSLSWRVAFFNDDRAHQPDNQSPNLHHIIATTGITYLHFTFLEGLSRGKEVVDAAYQNTWEQVRAL